MISHLPSSPFFYAVKRSSTILLPPPPPPPPPPGQQARVIPRPAFVVGLDTAVRILNPKYYGGAEAGRDAALQDLQRLGVRFVVAGRLSQPGEGAGVFETMASRAVTTVPERFRPMFIGLSEQQFRVDLSSSQLRRLAADKPQL